MKRLFTTLVLAALLGFAAYKAGVWWLADQRMSEARQALGESGVLKRGKIGSGVEGRLVLSGAHWQDFELTQPLVIGRAELDAGSPIALLKALVDPSDLPANWSLQAEGLALVLEATMFRNWVTADGTGRGEQAALFALPCAPDPRQQLGSGVFGRGSSPVTTNQKWSTRFALAGHRTIPMCMRQPTGRRLRPISNATPLTGQ